MFKMRQKKAQAWGIDLIIGFTIFVVGILVFYFYALNQPQEGSGKIEIMNYEGETIASFILSEGYPLDWNETNAIQIGILTDHKINDTKLQYFYNLNVSDYGKTRAIFNTQFHYYFLLNSTIDIAGGIEGIGFKPQNPENLIKITRFTIYQNKPITAYIYVWE